MFCKSSETVELAVSSSRHWTAGEVSSSRLKDQLE